MTMVRSGWNWRTVAAQCWTSPGGLVRPMPGKAVCTTRHPLADKAAANAGLAEYMPESPTIIAVPTRGSRSLLAGGANPVVVGAALLWAVVIVVAGVITVGARSRSVRKFANANAWP